MAKSGVLESDEASKVMELKKELSRLVNTIVKDEEEGGEIYDRAKETILALKDCKFFKKSSTSSCFKIESLDYPQHFRCPISKEFMKDPVILASGQTYDRQFIQGWLDAGFRTCPKTEQVLSHTNLVPNNLVREMISEWFKNKGIVIPSPVHRAHEQGITKEEKECFKSLLKKVVSSPLSEQKQAAKELRSLTKRLPSFRSLFGESPDAIPQLLRPLSMGKDHCPPDLQDDLVATVFNLSIPEENKKLVAETTEAIPLLIESLSAGTVETRSNAAAALFTLAALDSNKSMIGLAGALKPLIILLEDPLAMKDAASAIFQLCISQDNRVRAVRDGAVKVIMQKILNNIRVNELVAILAMLSGHQDADEEMATLGAVSCLLSIMRESACGRTKENCIAILFSICYSDRNKLREIKEAENSYGTISQLAQNGTSRARRKATGILERLKRTASLTHTA